MRDELVAQFNALGGDTRKQERFMGGMTPNQVDKRVRWARPLVGCVAPWLKRRGRRQIESRLCRLKVAGTDL